jgi:hypothetical protein
VRDPHRVLEVTGGLLVTISAGGSLAKWATLGADAPLWTPFFDVLVGFVVLGSLMFLIGVLRPSPKWPARVPNRYRLYSWVDERRGRRAALGHRQDTYLDALRVERQSYAQRGNRRSIRDVDKQIRELRRTGFPWLDEQADATPINQTAP